MSIKIDDTLHIKNFVDQINKADNSRQKNVTLDIENAKRVRNALTNVLLLVVDLQNQAPTSSQNVNVNMDGGNFK